MKYLIIKIYYNFTEFKAILILFGIGTAFIVFLSTNTWTKVPLADVRLESFLKTPISYWTLKDFNFDSNQYLGLRKSSTNSLIVYLEFPILDTERPPSSSSGNASDEW